MEFGFRVAGVCESYCWFLEVSSGTLYSFSFMFAGNICAGWGLSEEHWQALKLRCWLGLGSLCKIDITQGEFEEPH